MSDFGRDLTNQRTTTTGTQAWLKQGDDWAATDKGKAILDKVKRGEKLDAGDPASFNTDNFTSVYGSEQNQYNTYKHWLDKAKAAGVEDPTKISTATGVPDLTDTAVRARRAGAMAQMLTGNGRKQSFLGGNYGAQSLGGLLGGTP